MGQRRCPALWLQNGRYSRNMVIQVGKCLPGHLWVLYTSNDPDFTTAFAAGFWIDKVN